MCRSKDLRHEYQDVAQPPSRFEDLRREYQVVAQDFSPAHTQTKTLNAARTLVCTAFQTAKPYVVLIETFAVPCDRVREQPEVVVEALYNRVEVSAGLCGRVLDFLVNFSKTSVHLPFQPPNV